MAGQIPTTGMGEVDRLIGGLIQGDNVVWEVNSVAPVDSRPFGVPSTMEKDLRLLTIVAAVAGRVAKYMPLAEESVPVNRAALVIGYDSTTINPIEIFIKGKMTSVNEIVRTGMGTLGASFREIPAVALSKAKQIIKKLERTGLETLIGMLFSSDLKEGV
ncbi:MAG: DUF128 domain-containing protein [Proteobacteria bacterium]|nr:DUF128 domain-containing protein [Pseudomonadota bacterium]